MRARRRRFGTAVGWVGAGVLGLLLAAPAAAQTPAAGATGTGKKAWTPPAGSAGNGLAPTQSVSGVTSGLAGGTNGLSSASNRGGGTGRAGNAGGLGGFGAAARLTPAEEIALIIQALDVVEAVAAEDPTLTDGEVFFLVVMVYEDLRMQALFGQAGGTGTTPGTASGP